MNKEYTIRPESQEDRRTVEELVRDSFWNVYRPGCLEHYVLHRLRTSKDFVSELNYVLEKNGKIIGQIVFVKASIRLDSGVHLPILTMGPICIANAYKHQGYGKILLDYSLKSATELGYKAVCMEGNIKFYGHSGFTEASKFGIRYYGVPEGEDASFFLAKELETGYFEGKIGIYETPKIYFVANDEPEAFEKYEATFPSKEKLKLPSQLFN